MLRVGQEFKNYKDICRYLKEEVKTGRSKELQLKRWQLSFSWHKEGHKIIVDKVFRDYVRPSNGGNRRHLEAFMPYVIYSLRECGVNDEYIGTQRMIKSELKLIPSKMYDAYNGDEEYVKKNGITSQESLRKFVHSFEVCVNDTLPGCLKELEKGGGITWSPGQIFIIGSQRWVHSTGYGEILDDIETKVCNKMNTEGELKGRQYLHVIKRDPEMIEAFYKECIRLLIYDNRLIEEIKDKYEKKYGTKFTPDLIKKYYRLYYIGEVNENVLRKWKLPDKIDSVRLKKAFVNRVGQEIQMLKKKVYEDIFQRMGSKLGIPDEDFRKLKYLVMNFPENNQKLTNKDYSPSKDEKQGGNEDEFLREDAVEN